MSRTRLGRTTALALALAAVTATPAFADPNRPRPVPPATSPGLDNKEGDRPDQARTPAVGPQNRFTHGNPPG